MSASLHGRWLVCVRYYDTFQRKCEQQVSITDRTDSSQLPCNRGYKRKYQESRINLRNNLSKTQRKSQPRGVLSSAPIMLRRCAQPTGKHLITASRRRKDIPPGPNQVPKGKMPLLQGLKIRRQLSNITVESARSSAG